MENIFLIIKYQDKFVCEYNSNKYGFIEVPYYGNNDGYGNITIFLNIFFHEILNNSYGSIEDHTVDEWEVMFQEQEIIPDPDQQIIIEVAPNRYVFDMDKMFKEVLQCYINEVNSII